MIGQDFLQTCFIKEACGNKDQTTNGLGISKRAKNPWRMNCGREGRQKLMMTALPVFQTSGRTVYERLEKPQIWLFTINDYFSGYLKTSSFTLTLYKTD
jgi:hypothetical protein